MASYFDEHDCAPLQDGEQPNDFLHFARLLLDSEFAREWDLLFASILNGDRPSPPTSKKVIEELPTVTISAKQQAQGAKCPVCLGEYEEGNEARQLPCDHIFHTACILPWLNKTNTCPLCREELPTDDKDYEELKRQKAQQKQKDYEKETLHDAMYG